MLRIKVYENQIVAYASNGRPPMCQQYQERVNVGISQCTSGQSRSLEQLCGDTDNDYAAL